jgi:HK97 family phage major capsid protein
VTAANASSIVAADLIDLFHGVDPAYRNGPKVAFMMNDSTLKAIRKLKDDSGGAGVGNFLWMAGLSAGIPDTILGKPYFVNQDMASIATTNKTVLFGDFSKYLIRNVREITMLRLVERYADFHQVGFLAFSRHDGRILDAGTDPLKVLVHP